MEFVAGMFFQVMELTGFTICAWRLCGQFRKQFRRNSGNGFLHGSDMHFYPL